MRLKIDPERVRAAFGEVRHVKGFEESCALFEVGRLPVEMLQAMSLRPEILKAFGHLGEGTYPGGLLERNLQEKVILKASKLNGCQFCVNSHREIMKHLGIPHAQIEQLEAPENLTDRELLAVRYTEAVIVDSNRVGDDLFTDLNNRFSPEEMIFLKRSWSSPF